jgi:hypothetical protein
MFTAAFPSKRVEEMESTPELDSQKMAPAVDVPVL